MTDIRPAVADRPALGVGSIFTETFAIFFRRIHWFLLLAIAPALGMKFLDNVMVYLIEDPTTDYESLFQQVMIYAAISALVSAIGVGLATALIAQAAHDVKLGRRMRLLSYFGNLFRNIVPLVVLSLALAIATAAGFLLFLGPGIWLIGLWSVFVPAMVIERCGFSAAARSHALTRGYRWQASGAFLLVVLIIVLVEGLITTVVWGFGMYTPPDLTDASWVIDLVAYTLLGAIQLALSGICAALIYARLRDIREGVPIETLEEVFD